MNTTTFELSNILRPHIEKLTPYSSARDEYSGTSGVFLDANENPIGSVSGGDYNRYPDPYQREIKKLLAGIKNVDANQIFLGNGSDEAIDLLYRAFCRPLQDNIVIMPPTYGMYSVSAEINTTEIRKASLTPDYQIDVESVFAQVDDNTKIIFVCSPNNPTGNSLNTADIEAVLERFTTGIVVVDEAYIDFSSEESYTQKLAKYPNLVVLQTFSKAWGMAGLRLGMAFASQEIIEILNKIKPPYNINQVTQDLAVKALQNVAEKDSMVTELLAQRDWMAKEFEAMEIVETVYPSDANFLLIKIKGADKIYNDLIEEKVIVRNRSKVTLCDSCLRISIGTEEENKALFKAMSEVL